MEPLGLTITDAAAALGLTRNTLSELVNGKRGISPEMAFRLSEVFGGTARTAGWCNRRSTSDPSPRPHKTETVHWCNLSPDNTLNLPHQGRRPVVTYDNVEVLMAETRKTRPVSWIEAALKDFQEFPEGAKSITLAALTIAAEGGKADIAKPLHGFGSGVLEVALALPRRRLSRRLRCSTRGRDLGHPCFPKEIEAGHRDAKT